jgi:hypothetical protein
MVFHPNPENSRPRRKGDEFSYFHMKNEKITRSEGDEKKKRKLFWVWFSPFSSLCPSDAKRFVFLSIQRISRSLMDGKKENEKAFSWDWYRKK